MTSMKKTWVAVLIGISILVLPSFAVMYWYAHSHDIYRNSLQTIQSSALARNLLGENIKPSPFVYVRISERIGNGEARYRVSGSNGTAVAEVSAKKVGEEWQFRWIWLRLESGKYVVVVGKPAKAK